MLLSTPLGSVTKLEIKWLHSKSLYKAKCISEFFLKTHKGCNETQLCWATCHKSNYEKDAINRPSQYISGTLRTLREYVTDKITT